jgi:hypothetical protein
MSTSLLVYSGWCRALHCFHLQTQFFSKLNNVPVCTVFLRHRYRNQTAIKFFNSLRIAVCLCQNKKLFSHCCGKPIFLHSASIFKKFVGSESYQTKPIYA